MRNGERLTLTSQEVREAFRGNEEATKKVLEAAPSLGERKSASLSTLGWAQVGLSTARENVLKALNVQEND